MKYCGGGDLSFVIKQAARTNRPIPEDKIWGYFLQILLALNYCHHPNGHARSSSGSGTGISAFENAGSSARAQILHRDLKPDNVFLDTADKVKLADFGLSRDLTQATFASTYVGVHAILHVPELMQEKAYDTKSDIWSLGCVIYELCALIMKPPFHEAKTHQELSNCIRNGPLPRGYSQTLASVIKSMLSLNPAMRPSAAQLLQHERLALTLKVIEAEKILASVKGHRADAAAKERDLNLRETLLHEREQQMVAAVAQKDAEIANLQHMVAALQEQQVQQQQPNHYSQQQMETAVKEAVGRREEELRVLVMKREKEVADAMSRREEEIMEAVRRREAEVCEAWTARETEIRREIEEKVKEVDERIDWIEKKEEELKVEDARLDTARVELEEKMAKWEESVAKGRKEKTPLEEVKNILAPLARLADDTPSQQRWKLDNPTPKPPLRAPFPSLSTPIARTPKFDAMPSAMKGVVLTSTGELLATPAPGELTNLFSNSPRVGLNFTKIFNFESGDEDEDEEDTGTITPTAIAAEQEPSPPPSPSSRKEKEKTRAKERERDPSSDTGSSTSSSTNAASSTSNVPPTRLRRPSIRSRPPVQRSATLPSSTSTPDSTGLASGSGSASTSQIVPRPLPHPHLNNTTTRVTPVPRSQQAPEYLADEENLPSPFIKCSLDRAATTRASSTSAKPVKKRPSSGHTLRAVAVANAAGKRVSASVSSEDVPSEFGGNTRPALASARKATAKSFVRICKIVMGAVLSQTRPPYFAKELISSRTPRVTSRLMAIRGDGQPDTPDIEDINDVRNGLYIYEPLHRLLGKGAMAFLKTPNFAMHDDDVPPSPLPIPGPPSASPGRFILQHFKPPYEVIETHAPHNQNARLPADMSQFPPPIIVDMFYGCAAVLRWGITEAKSFIELSVGPLYYDFIEAAASPTNVNESPRSRRAKKHESPRSRRAKAGASQHCDQSEPRLVRTMDEAMDFVSLLWMRSAPKRQEMPPSTEEEDLRRERVQAWLETQ
ncbi:hypothetical protein D9615_003271 [Tricholomella constricta]|uniref:non-specific serine/threonine protein kinase n=1 Tax=Tricholomella constricta TaxID=117010 RepID=A0A8H5HIV4_9AGAR|nr:hypothetical protein D9615_003271 [Tricholomella constricta]